MAARKKTSKSRQKAKRNKAKFSRAKVSKQIQNRVKELQTKLEAALAKQVVQKEEVSTSTVDLELKKPSEPNGIAVSPSEYDCIVNTFKNPKINNRHKILSLIHNHLVGLEVRFQKEIFELEDRYLKNYYAPLQTLRKVLIEANSNGKQHYPYEKTLVENCKSSFSNDLQKYTELQLRVERLLFSGHGEASKNCHDFWLVVFLHSDPILRDLIQPCDVDILKYLTDVRSEPVRLKAAQQLTVGSEVMDSCDVAVGYDIFFDFRPNPYFSNSVLTKRYLIDVLPDQCDFVINSHNDVLSSEWLNRPSDFNKGTYCSKSSLCRSIFSQDHSIDKLLDYNGPQIIAIQGCQIRWTSKASFMKGHSMVSYYDKANGFSLKCTEPVNILNQSPEAPQTSLSQGLKRNAPDFSVASYSKNESNVFTPSMGVANLNTLPKLDTTGIDDDCFSNTFSKPFDAKRCRATPPPPPTPPFVDPGSFRAKSLFSKADSKFKKTKNFLMDIKFTLFTPSPSRRTETSFDDDSTSDEKSSSNATNGVKCSSSFLDDDDEFLFFSASTIPKVSRGTTSMSQTSVPDFGNSSTPTPTKPKLFSQGRSKKSEKESRGKSFFNFFDATWNEKSPDHCKQILKDYQVGSYIRDILIPRAYLFYRQKDVEDHKKERHDRQVFTCLGGRYDKAFKLSVDPEAPLNYDEIDEDIPIAVTNQALTKIESCASLKKEIIENNKETAARIANSFIGQMIRMRDDVISDVDDEVPCAITKCSTTHESKIDVDDAIVKSTSRDNNVSIETKASREPLSVSSTSDSVATSFDSVSQSLQQQKSTSVENPFSFDGGMDSDPVTNTGTSNNKISSDMFNWCDFEKPDPNMEVGDEEDNRSEDSDMSRDFSQVESVLKSLIRNNPIFSVSSPDGKAESYASSIVGDMGEANEKPSQSNPSPEIHLTTLYDSPASDTDLYQGTPNPYFAFHNRGSRLNLKTSSSGSTVRDVTMENAADEKNLRSNGNDVAEANDTPMSREPETGGADQLFTSGL